MTALIIRPILLIAALLATVTGVEGYTPQSYKGTVGKTEKELPYQLLKPEKVVAGTTYPLVIFLHGAGERGTDNQAQKKWCVGSFENKDLRAKFPCYVIVPQCAVEYRWVEVHWGEAAPHTMPKEPSVPMGLLMGLLPKFIKENPVDQRRIYVIGLSMGGFGTWDLLARMPTTFAAGIPICGGADNSTAPSIAHIPLWVWHGDKDGVVPTVRSRSMVEALKAAGGTPRYNEIPGGDHFAWNPAWGEPTLLDWLFAQQLPEAKAGKKKAKK